MTAEIPADASGDIHARVVGHEPSRPDASSPQVDAWQRFGSRRRRIVVESLLLGLTLVLATVWFSAPYVARDYINRGLAGLPDYTGRVEWVRIHPWSARFDLYDTHLDKRTGKIPVHFYYSPRTTISLQWSEIFHGVERASVVAYHPIMNLVTGSNAGDSQLAISTVWLEAIKKLIPWRVNQVRIHQGEVHFLDFHADPHVDLEITEVEVAADNITNSKKLKVPLPATVKITGRPLTTGTLEMNLAVDFDQHFATFTQNLTIQHVPAVGANTALQKYLKVRVKSGEIALYSEVAGDKGMYHGYVKPFFYRLEFEPKPSDEGNPGAIWSGILNTAKGLFENDKQVIATQSDVSGRLDQPQVDALSVMSGVLWNAYIEALRPGFDPLHPPSNPAVAPAAPSSVPLAQGTAPPPPIVKNK